MPTPVGKGNMERKDYCHGLCVEMKEGSLWIAEKKGTKMQEREMEKDGEDAWWAKK